MKSARLFALLLPASLAVTALAQTAAPSPAQPLPTDPAALLQLASQVNGLHGSNLKPWHIHATWQFQDHGQVTDHGTFEEWWAGEKKSRTVITSSTGNRTTWVTDHGVYLPPASSGMPQRATVASGMLLQPVPDFQVNASPNVKWKKTRVKDGGVSLDCILREFLMPNGQPAVMIDAHGDSRLAGTQFCFADKVPAIRTESTGAAKTAFNSVVLFQGQYLAKKIETQDAYGNETDITVDLIEALDPVNDADFLPPADATLLPAVRKVALSSGVAQGNRIGGGTVAYPPEAEANHVQGTVVLRITISTEGKVTDLHVISGAPELQSAAMEAVRTWRYRPYLLNGTPVEVETQVNVVFTLSQ